MKKTIVLVALLLVGGRAAADPMDELVAELQMNPSDLALREQIIAKALKMKHRGLRLSAEAIEAAGAAEYAFKNAKTEADFAASAALYEQAMLAAPWHAGYHYDQGVALEKAGQFEAALDSFELFVLASPNSHGHVPAHRRRPRRAGAAPKSPDDRKLREEDIKLARVLKSTPAAPPAAPHAKDAEEVEKKIYELELAAEQTAKPIDVSGRWRKVGTADEWTHEEFKIEGGKLVMTVVWDETHTYPTGPARQAGERKEEWSAALDGQNFHQRGKFVGRIEGDVILVRKVGLNGIQEYRYLRQR